MAKRRKMKVEEQMDMLEEGGLLDEGGTVDPVSGNDVPSGSTQEEVRDDIPAQLSEGEFVFPADVVRYIGLENLMKLRQKAKAGLQKMEDMGQMGNAEEAIMDDDGAYKDEIGSMIDNLELAQGGMVPQQNIPPIGPPVGNTMPGQVAPPMPTTSAFQMQPSTAMNQTTRPNLAMAQGGAVMTVEQEMMQKSNKPQNFAQGGAVMSVEQEMMQKSKRGYAQGGAVIPVEQEMMQKSKRQNFRVGGTPQPVPTITPPAQVPTYSQFMGQTTPGQGPASPVVYGTEQYIGPNGDIIGITTINGNPVQDIPAGYKKYNPATDTPAKPAVAEPSVQEGGGGDSAEERAREEQRQRDYAGYLTELNVLSEFSPTFSEFVEKNMPGQKRAAETMVIDPETGLPSFPDMGFTEALQGLFGGENYKAIAEGVKGFFGENAAEKAYSEIADNLGFSLDDYKTEGFLGFEEFNKDKMVEDLQRWSGLDDNQREERKATADRYNTNPISEQTDMLAEQDRGLFDDDIGQDDIGTEGTDLGDAGDTSNNDGPSGGESPTGDDTEGTPFAKGGVVKQTKKKGLGRLKT